MWLERCCATLIVWMIIGAVIGLKLGPIMEHHMKTYYKDVKHG